MYIVFLVIKGNIKLLHSENGLKRRFSLLLYYVFNKIQRFDLY